MNKNFFLGMFATASMLLSTSCSNDELEVIQSGNEAQITFSVGTKSGIGSRALVGDGTKADKLVWAVYNQAGDLLKVFKDANNQYVGQETHTGISDMTQTAKEVSVSLAKGQTYKVLFWAQDEDCDAYVTSDLKNVEVKYPVGAVNNDERRDAFFACKEIEVKGNETFKVDLKRPFAQVNVGVTKADWNAAVASGITVEQSKVVIKNAATHINLMDGSVSGSQEVTYDLANIITSQDLEVDLDENKEVEEDEKFKYLSMSYILVDDESNTGSEKANLESLEFTFDPANGNDIIFKDGLTNVPVQRNWRTNIIGQILTGTIKFEVKIDNRFEDDNNLEWSDGYYIDGNTITLYNEKGLKWVAENVDENDGFAGKTIVLANDIDLTASNWDPIGDNRDEEAFKGTFDGQNHTIYGAHISGDHCWDGSVYGSKEGWGLFSVLDEAVVKNLKVDGATFGSYTVISGAIAGYAYDTTFENIEISNTKIAGYNWYTGGVVGWAGGECTFKNVNLDNTVTVGTLWDSHGQCAGGIAGGISSSAVIAIEDCNIACVLDVINDVTSNYKWWIYRVSGMIIGNISTTQTIDGKEYPNPSNVTCKNVTVTYGDWMNYHYCQGYWKRGWGRVESSDYVGGIDHTQCNHPTGEQHYVCIPFDQLFGGGPNGDGRNPVYGLKEFDGVTVNYPYTYNVAEVTNATELNNAVTSGQNVMLTADVNMGTTQLALDNVKIDLNGKTLTTANNWGGMTLKNGACIKNGTINHTGNTAAIKAWKVGEIEDVTINVTPTDGKIKGGIVIQNGADSYIGSLKNVTISGATNGIETYNCGWTDETPAIGTMENVNIDATDTGILLSAHIGKATNCQIKGVNHGINMHLKGEFKVGIELEKCIITGTIASIWGHDEKDISNTKNCSLNLTYDAATTLNGPFVWDFEDECLSVVTLNKPQ